ncbi:MAG TPA: hypothetical protein VG755_15440 [Nannocystaceae bacterium]|nr:hypothetical protein [Nannocystaceae bacterium]
MQLRALPIVLATFASGCFDDPPDVGNESESGAPMCEMGELGLPAVPEGWEGWAFVAMGSTMAPPPECPQGTTRSVVFAGVQEPTCGCVCEADVCGPRFSVGDVCGGDLAMQNDLIGCDAVESATAVDVSANPPDAMATMCSASPVPIPGPNAIPYAVCQLAGAGDSCVERPEGFMGPCIGKSNDECPAGFQELVASAVELQCGTCEVCATPTFCDSLLYELFGDDQCTSEVLARVSAPEGCMDTSAPFRAVRVAPVDPAASACEKSDAQTVGARICCLP